MRNGSPLRVLRLTPHFYYPHGTKSGWPITHDPIGGMQSQIYYSVEGLSRLGIEQVILTLGIPGAPRVWRLDERTTVHASLLPLPPIRSELRGSMGLNETWTASVMLWLGRHLARMGPGFDIVHAHGSGVCWPLLAGVPAASALRARLVYTVHCSKMATYHAMSKLDTVMNPIGQWWERRCLKRADRVITLTERTAEVYRRRRVVPDERLRVIPDGLDAKQFADGVTPERVEAFRVRHQLPRDKRLVLYLGRVAIEKGWPRFVKMASRLTEPDLHFVVCGDGNQRAQLEARVAELGLRHRFTVTGFVPREDVPLALELSDVFVLTSEHEEFGSSTLEAMAMGVPVVASRVGGLADNLTDETNALLVDLDADLGFATATRRILTDATLAQRLVTGGLAFVARMSMTRRVREHADLYASLVPEASATLEEALS